MQIFLTSLPVTSVFRKNLQLKLLLAQKWCIETILLIFIIVDGEEVSTSWSGPTF